MIGDRVTGGIVSSNIQFVKPELLKADLNKQFRERFDGWEPPKSQRKYIGARVIDGVYTLMDLSGPGVGAGGDSGTVGTEEEDSHQPTTTTATSGTATATPRKRGGSISSLSTTADSNIRMPPSLTLSKIRSIKRQVSQLEIRYFQKARPCLRLLRNENPITGYSSLALTQFVLEGIVTIC